MVGEAIHRYHTAKGYFQSAMMIARSAERNTEERRLLTLLSLCMLSAFALELYFKAYLLAAGAPSRDVRAFNHRLGELWRVAQEAGLARALQTRFPLSEQVEQLVSILAPGHEDFTFRYVGDASLVVAPLDWEQAFAVLDALDDLVDEKVGASAAYGLEAGRHA